MRQDGLAEGAKELCHQNDFFLSPWLMRGRPGSCLSQTGHVEEMLMMSTGDGFSHTFIHWTVPDLSSPTEGGRENCRNNALIINLLRCHHVMGWGGAVHDGTVQQTEAIETGAYWNRPSPQEYVCLCVKLIYSCLCGFFCSFFPTSYCEHFKMHINMDSLTFYSTWCSMCLLHPLLYLSINPTYF